LGLTYFLLNGWKIRPYEATHVFSVNGNLYSEDGTSPFLPTIGGYNVTIISSVSNLVEAISTGGGSGASAAEIWNYPINNVSTGTTGKKLADGLTTGSFIALK
jgi:hypothetical protein